MDQELPAAIVWLRGAGEAVRAEEITADKVEALLPDPRSAREVREFFESSGFKVTKGEALLSIAGPQELFESTFKTQLRVERTDERITSITTEKGELELPLGALPDSVVRAIQVVSFEEPPDFGPTDF